MAFRTADIVLKSPIASIPINVDWFGASAQIVNGNQFVVGAPYAYDPNHAGAVFIFGASGSHQFTLETNTPDRYGSALAVAGSQIIIGAQGVPDKGYYMVGRVDIWSPQAAGGWTLGRTIVCPDPFDRASFGSGLIVDGNDLYVTAPGLSSVYRFDLTTGIQTLNWKCPVGYNPSNISSYRCFNIIGSYGQDQTNVQTALFDNLTATQLRLFQNPSKAASSYGYSTAVTGDYLLVGDPIFNSDGAAHLFDIRSGALLRTIPAPKDPFHALFGHAVCFHKGNIVVGQSAASLNGPGSGAAHIFDVTTGALLQTLADVAPKEGGEFGARMYSNGTQLLVGAPAFSPPHTDVRGTVHIFNI